MRIDTFRMERMQALYEYQVEYNLSESGVWPLTVAEVLDGRDLAEFAGQQLYYPEAEGSDVLRERIATWYPDASAGNVTVATGGSEVNHLTLWTLLDRSRGDRLAFMLPNYLQGWGLGRHYGAGTDTFRLRVGGDEGGRRWALDVDELRAAVTKRTRAVLVTNPNNPTGAVLTEDEMDAVVDAAQRVGAWVVADEIYRGAELQGDGESASTPTFWGRYDKVVVTSGLSKAFGLPGLRIGWAVAPPRLIGKLWRRHDYTSLSPAFLSERLARIVMAPARREAVLARTRRILRENLPRLESWIAEQEGLLTHVRPVAGAIATIRYALPIGSIALADRIRREQSVLIVPGKQFGLGRYFRVGFGYEIDHTLKGLARVEETLRQLARG
ncbi:MAG TPA: aminotransferase class I/II-fold pyridoxal phosphate-dependent enzyme [Actinomycetota bacterium]